MEERDEFLKWSIENNLNQYKLKYSDEVEIRTITTEQDGKDVRLIADIKSISPYTITNENLQYFCSTCYDEFTSFNKGYCSKCKTFTMSQKTGTADGFFFAKATQITLPDESNNPVKYYDLILSLGPAQSKLYMSLVEHEKYYLFGTIRIRSHGRKDPYMYLELHYAHKIDSGLEQIKITNEQKEIIMLEHSKPEFIKNLKTSIYGESPFLDAKYIYDMLLLQLVGSQKEYSDKGVLKQRGNIHIMLAGSPGLGKTFMMKTQQSILPRSAMASATGSTAIGLTATAQQDKVTGAWEASYGLIPLCHKGGIACIDEFDKAKVIQDKLNTILESLEFKINKATINFTIKTDVSMLVSLNPKGKTYDINDSIFSQLNIDDDVKDRFDFIVNVDYFKKKSTNSMFDTLRVTPKSENNELYAPFDVDFILKFIVLAKQFNPVFTDDIVDQFEERYKNLTAGTSEDNYRSPRLFNSIVRMCRAYARLRLSNYVELVDLNNAFNLLTIAYKSLGLIKYNFGVESIDLYKAENITRQSKKDKVRTIKEFIKLLDPGPGVSLELIKQSCTFDDVDDILEFMSLRGEVMSPKANHYKLVQ